MHICGAYYNYCLIREEYFFILQITLIPTSYMCVVCLQRSELVLPYTCYVFAYMFLLQVLAIKSELDAAVKYLQKAATLDPEEKVRGHGMEEGGRQGGGE